MKTITALSICLFLFISCSGTSTKLIKRDIDCTLKEDTTTAQLLPPVTVAIRYLEKRNIEFYPDSVDIKIVNYYAVEYWMTFRLKKPINDWSKLDVYVVVSKDGCASLLDFK